MAEQLYDGSEMHRVLVEAAIARGHLEPHAPGLRTKMTTILGERHPSSYSRAMQGSKTLQHLGRWCDRLGVRFVWSEGSAHFVEPTDVFVWANEEPVAVEEGSFVVVAGDGRVVELTDPMVLERLGLTPPRMRNGADPLDFSSLNS